MWIAHQLGWHSSSRVAGAIALTMLLACVTAKAQDICNDEQFRNAYPQRCEGWQQPSDQAIAVPDVVGLPELIAVIQLGRKHLAPSRGGSEQSNQSRGTLLRTEPAAGTKVPRDSEVVYWISSGDNSVPDLTGLSGEQARRSLRREGFVLGTVGEQPSDGPPRIVLAQVPVPGSTAEVGTRVAVTVSSDEVVVPDVVGLSASDAITRLQQTSLEPASGGELASSQSRGIVLRSKPPAGTRVRRGDSVAYVIASGQNMVPDLRGRTATDAAVLLSPAGFRPGATDERADLGSAGRVLEQSPPAGSLAALGTTVAMTLSRVLQVPELRGKSSQEARAQLIALGLVPQADGSESSTQSRGEVLRSDPVAGTRVLDRARVAYVVASGRNVVPDLSGELPDAAANQLKENGFRLGDIAADLVPNADGRIRKQSPAKDTPADLGSSVSVTISTPYPPVPNVIGTAGRYAEQRLRDHGFKPKRGTPEHSEATKDIVLRTFPAAGSLAPPETAVTYWPASGENIVPDLRKQSQSAARHRLKEAGFVVGEISHVYASGVDEQIGTQSPRQGTLAPLGTPVSLTVTSGVPIVPDLVGKPFDEAKALLQQAGLAVGATTHEYRLGKADVVITQQPAPGERRSPGTTVALLISRSPVIAGIGAGTVLLGLAGAWWTQLRPWPLKLPLHVDARLEPIEPVAPQWIDSVKPMGSDFDVVVSAHVDAVLDVKESSIPIDHVETRNA